MASTLKTNATKLAQLINPQVIGDFLEKKLVDEIKFSPLATINDNLVGNPGTTLDIPFYTYIGDAADVTEGGDIALGQLTEDKLQATIKSIGKGVQITDAAVLSGYGDPISEAGDQLLKSLASKVDSDFLTALNGIASSMTHTVTGNEFTADDIADALVKFGEDIDGEKVIVVSPATYAALRKADDWCPASEIAAAMVIQGAVGMVHGCQVVLSNKLKDTYAKQAYIVKPGALALIMKRGVEVEADRDILNKSTIITADQWYVAYLYNAAKAIKMVHA